MILRGFLNVHEALVAVLPVAVLDRGSVIILYSPGKPRELPVPMASTAVRTSVSKADFQTTSVCMISLLFSWDTLCKPRSSMIR